MGAAPRIQCGSFGRAVRTGLGIVGVRPSQTDLVGGDGPRTLGILAVRHLAHAEVPEDLIAEFPNRLIGTITRPADVD